MATLRYWDVTANAYLPIPALNAPPSGPAGGDLKGLYPNPSVGMGVPNPLSSGAPFTQFTDNLGDIWVAKGGVNGGVFRRARDVLYVKVARLAAITIGTGNNPYPWDTTVRDLYGMFVYPNITVPLQGTWLLTSSTGYNLPAGAQTNNLVIRNGVTQEAWSASIIGAGGSDIALAVQINCAANDTLQLQINANIATPILAGQGYNNMAVSYIGMTG